MPHVQSPCPFLSVLPLGLYCCAVVNNGLSSEASSLQSKQVALDVIDILHVLQLFLTYILSKHKKYCYVVIKT